MLKTGVSLVLLVVLAGCSALSYHDRDMSNPSYHLTRNEPVVARSPEELAVTGVMLSGLSLAMNQDYYKPSWISGRLICRPQKEPEFEIPCSHVSVALTDVKGNVVSQSYCEEGEFSFPAERGKGYFIRVESSRYQLVDETPHRLEMGDSVVLHLIEKRPTLSE